MSNYNSKTYLVNKLQLLRLYKTHFENKLKLTTPSISNRNYLRYLSVLSKQQDQIDLTKKRLKTIQQNARFYNKLFVKINSRVKLISTEIGAVIWIDAKNITEIIGKRVGEIIQFQNSRYLIAGVY